MLAWLDCLFAALPREGSLASVTASACRHTDSPPAAAAAAPCAAAASAQAGPTAASRMGPQPSSIAAAGGGTRGARGGGSPAGSGRRRHHLLQQPAGGEVLAYLLHTQHNSCPQPGPVQSGSARRGPARALRLSNLIGYTWVSFGLEAASWRLQDIFTVLLWPPTTTSVQRCLVPWRGKPCFRSRRVSGLGWLHRSVAGWRIALILTVCYCGAAVLICVISVNLTASVVADRLAARGRSRRDAG